MTFKALDSTGAALNVLAGAGAFFDAPGVSFLETQLIASVTLDGATFIEGDHAGTVIGAITVTMNAASPAFSGTLSLPGADAALFQLSDTSLPANLELAGTGVEGTYDVSIVATQDDRIGNSPKTTGFTITGEPASAYTGPLDIQSGAVVAYSAARALSAAMRGSPVYTIREDAGDATQSFSSDATTGLVDVTAITAFLGGASGFGALWNDQSGNGRDVSNAITTEQPQWEANIVNSLPAFHNSGGSRHTQLYTSSSIAVPDAFTFFCVLKHAAPGNNNGDVLAMWDGVSSTYLSFSAQSNASSINACAANIADDANNFDVVAAGPSLGLNVCLLDSVLTHGTQSMFANGADVSTPGQDDVLGSRTASPIIIGNDLTSDPTDNDIKAYLVEIVMYGSILGEPIRLAIRQNIADFYGITLP